MPNDPETLETRSKRMRSAIGLKEPDRVPISPWASGFPYAIYPEIGASHKSAMYDYEKAAEAHIRYHREFEPDAISTDSVFLCGKAGEFLKPTMMDWPGRPGTPLPDDSIYQMFEVEYLKADEYDELLGDYTRFIFNKYLPRSFEGLKGLEGFRVNPSPGILDSALTPLAAPEVQEALKRLVAYGEERAKTDAAFGAFIGSLIGAGFPPFFTAVGGVPFDILSDYFRGTTGTLYDQVERPEKIAAACELFADIQIAALSFLEHAPLPVKCVFFPMHKGMDGFMSDEQYRDLYWAPYQKILRYLISIGATPLIFTEGPYNTRYEFIAEQLREFPPGSCIVNFEMGDFPAFKRTFRDVACIFGGVPIDLINRGTKEQVEDRVKYLVDNCADGGGYIIGTSGPIEGNAKRENVEAMFETAREYGKR
jgi:hypothetical protein